MSELAAETPIAVGSDGTLKVVWVPTIANPQQPTAAELNAGTAIDLTLYILAGGYTSTISEETVDDARLGSRQTFALPGRISESNEITYVFQAQEPLAADNKAYSTLKRNTRGYLVTRWGTEHEPDFATGDIVDIVPSVCGEQRKSPGETNSQQRVVQTLNPTGVPRRDVVVVAGA